ncbi:uncharacterized protein F4812DRAFT_455013 [Daldinia caldariorum]|uniref:uncharacterized protein n=1 Tax=Daldinia caldariorum TaxID=326644 RepID=UPI0020076838|nr:uncharacterized protein F4812DRAFT_455013 [Daldinia caldariorum]KAI1473199.1 hypothetical protein F4812DRAFT_455013 [Daldinia caldariorum]
MILLSIASFLFVCLLLVYRFGPRLRGWSKFAQTLAEAEAEAEAEVEAETGVTTELNVSRFDSAISHTAVIHSYVSDGGENPHPQPATPHLGRMVHFLPPDSLPGSRAGSRFPSVTNSPAGTRPSSMDIEHLASCQVHGAQLSQHSSQAKPVGAAGRSTNNVSPVPEAVSSDDVSNACASCSGQTLAGTCTLCSQKSACAATPNDENESPPTSLQEVENADAYATLEPLPAIPVPAEDQSGALPSMQEKPKKRRPSGSCYIM